MTTSTAQNSPPPLSSGYDFDRARTEWAKPPFDNIGYLSSAEVLSRTPDELRALIIECERNRYALATMDGLCRNHANRWRESLGLDSTHGKRILDFGCGIGLEALQFARAGNRVVLADIAPDNLRLARRVLEVFGVPCEGTAVVAGEPPFFDTKGQFDIFYSNGVLHHTPRIREILARAHEVLRSGGEARLMLYSDKAWLHWVGGILPPIDADVSKDPGFTKFIRAFDDVGHYADWYSLEKVRHITRGLFEVARYEYITATQWYATVRLNKA